MVSKQMLQNWKIIIKDEYGRDLSDSEVFEIGNQIVGYYKASNKVEII